MTNLFKQPIGELLDTKGGKLSQIIIVLLSVSSWVYLYTTKDEPITMSNGVLSIFMLVWLFSNLFTLLLFVRYIFKFIGKRKITAIIVVVISILLLWFFLQTQETKSVANLESIIVENQLLLQPKENLSEAEFNDLLIPITKESCRTILGSAEREERRECTRVRADVPGVERDYALGEYDYDKDQYELGRKNDMILPSGPWNDEQALGPDFFSCGTRGCFPEVWFYFVGGRTFAAVEGTPIDQVNYEGLYVLSTDGSQWQRIIEASGDNIYFLENSCDIVYKSDNSSLLVNWCESFSN